MISNSVFLLWIEIIPFFLKFCLAEMKKRKRFLHKNHKNNKECNFFMIFRKFGRKDFL